MFAKANNRHVYCSYQFVKYSKVTKQRQQQTSRTYVFTHEYLFSSFVLTQTVAHRYTITPHIETLGIKSHSLLHVNNSKNK